MALDLYKKIELPLGVVIETRHVKGHTEGATKATFVNNWCDTEAKKAMRKARGK